MAHLDDKMTDNIVNNSDDEEIDEDEAFNSEGEFLIDMCDRCDYSSSVTCHSIHYYLLNPPHTCGE